MPIGRVNFVFVIEPRPILCRQIRRAGGISGARQLNQRRLAIILRWGGVVLFWGTPRNELNLGTVGFRHGKRREGKQWLRKPISLRSTSMSRIAREAERLDLEKRARLEAGLTDPVRAIQPAPTSDHQHREGLSFWQAVKTMFR
jgi:hypothetical protein